MSALRAATLAPRTAHVVGAARVLVVDDDASVRASLERALAASGYEVQVAADGDEALACLENESADVVILDVRMPSTDGLTVCRQLRADGNAIPIILLTARDSVGDRVAGLDAGADDYVVKPFALDELLARVRALLRRNQVVEAGPPLQFADLSLNLVTREARRGERVLELTRTEFHLLELFLRNPRSVLTRSMIYERIWGYDFGLGSKSLDVFIANLRRKLEAEGEARLIRTIRGVGYAMREP